MNVPNLLTVGRLGLTALFLAAIALANVLPLAMSAALLFFVVAGITDYLDGYLARNVYGITSFGRLMDPLADKVMVCAAFVSFTALGLVPAYIVVIIIAREFLVTGLRLLAIEKGLLISAGRWGKHKTIWQITAIIVILVGLAVRHDVLTRVDVAWMATYDVVFGYLSFAISVAVAIITVVSGYLYFAENREVLSRHL